MTETPFPDCSTKRAGTPAAFRKTMRKNWYVRSGQMTGVVPHPSAKLGVPRLAAALLPDVYRSETVARRRAKRRPLSVVLEHWGGCGADEVAPD